MAREKKEGVSRTFYLKKEITDVLDKYSAETGIPKTIVVEKAISAYLENLNSEKEEE